MKKGRWSVLQRPSRLSRAVAARVGDTRVLNSCGWGAKGPPPHSYVSDAWKAHASLGDTVTTVSVILTGPGAAGVISPNFFLFVTTIGVIVS